MTELEFSHIKNLLIRRNEVSMKQKHILPIQDPILKAYLHIGMPFSILPDKLIECGWVYNTYTQLVYFNEDPEDSFVDFTQERFWEESNVFTKGFVSFPARTQDERQQMMHEIRKLIDMGYYIYGEWDEFLIPGTPFYQRKPFRHYFLVYGYANGEIYAEGYLEDGHWHRFTVPEEIFAKSLLADRDRDKNGMIGINTYRPRSNMEARFDYDRIKVEVGKYLNCIGEKIYLPYGTEAIEAFFNDVREAMQQLGEFPIQSVYIIYEHKIMMQRRMEYMLANKFGACTREEVEQYKKLTEEFYTVVCNCVKYKIARKSSFGNRVYSKVVDIQRQEQELLRRVFV